MPENLDSSRDNPAAACGPCDKIECSIGKELSDGRRDGRERSLPWNDKVRRRRYVTECVRLIWYRKVVHLVVHDDSRFWYTELGSTECEPTHPFLRRTKTSVEYPKSRFTVDVSEIAMPEESDVTTCEVPCLGVVSTKI